MNRWPDWWAQAERDLTHARHALEDADHGWACFAAQQGAEKALKALVLALGGEPWGHSVLALVEALPAPVGRTEATTDAASRLDKHYIPTRYPNGFDSGFPGKLYTRGEAVAAIEDGEHILAFCRRHLPR